MKGAKVSPGLRGTSVTEELGLFTPPGGTTNFRPSTWLFLLLFSPRRTSAEANDVATATTARADEKTFILFVPVKNPEEEEKYSNGIARKIMGEKMEEMKE